ncbi:hypothetical protein E2H86_18360 [Pseudomonas putida]|uniref:hypothetical protein n=1 Tax=Pseudomonas TaxID=286 RepID=UPI001059396A|nr:hypothetical protein [Pseudomonas putida]TDJ75141.1 hypothetical protein E2H86_18360 [Pseudomonas putida]
MKEKSGLIFTDDWHDELSQLIEDPRNNIRRDIWLWLYLYSYEKADLEPATCNGTTMRSAIARVLKRNTRLLGRIDRDKDRFMVPIDYIKWIDGGPRQYQWLLRRIEDLTDLRPLRGVPQGLVHLTGRNHLIALLDLWDIDIAKKADKIEHLRKEWLGHKASDSDFEWFEDKKDGARRCQCAWEWLEKNHKPLPDEQLPIRDHTALLMYFDKATISRTEQKLIIKEIKKRWSRKQFGERNDDKKQVNVWLSKTVIALLDGLAEKHNLKRSDVLEHLIKIESESSACLADKLKDRR